MTRIRMLQLLLGLAVTVFAGCASMRGASVGTDPVYAIEVANQMPHAMTVFWSQSGGEPRSLGTVASGRTERFVIAGNTTNTISVTARDTNGTHRTGPYSVTLEAGVTKRVIVR
jgi:hypothetical protein